MFKINKAKLFLVVLAGFIFPQMVSAQQKVSLKDALVYALQHNSEIKKAKLEVEKGRYKVEEVRSQALPQIAGTAGLTYNPIIGQIVFGDQAIKMGRTWNSNAGVNLSQQLFNQTLFTGLKAAKASEAYYALNAELTDEQVIELVANNYYQVLVNRQQINVIDTNIKNVKVVQNIITNQYNNGLAKKIDVDRISVNLTNLTTQRDQAANAIILLENQLKVAMGMPIGNPIELPSSELTEVTELPALQESIDLSKRTEFKILDVQKQLLELQRKAYIAEYYPSLALSGNYTYATQSNNFDFLKFVNTNNQTVGYGAAAIGVTLRVPIFNGFLTRSKVRQATVEIQKADEDRVMLTNNLNLAYENAKIQLRNNLNTINAQRKNVELADEIYKSTQNNYNNGLASLTDLLETENSLTQAQNSYTQALLNYKVAEIQLIKSNGNIKSLVK